MQLINKSFTIEEFKSYVNSISIINWLREPDIKNRLQFPVIHNTSSPTQAQYKSWHDRKDWTMEQWGKNLASYYAGMGWQGCPHLFVGYDKILVLNDLSVHGTHTPSWNKISWGIETTAEFETEAFDGGVKDNLIAATAILCAKANFNPNVLKFHHDDPATTHRSCPGRNLVKSEFIKDVVNYINDNLNFQIGNDHPHIDETVHIADTSGMSIEELTSTKWLQLELNKLKFGPLTVDGVIGKNTMLAVKEFQKKENLTVDGIAGPLTRKALKSLG
jgi:hypothetical protein